MKETMNKVAVLDFGTARTKILVSEKNEATVTYINKSIETRLGKIFIDFNSAKDRLDALKLSLSKIDDEIRPFSIDRIICIGTEAFRTTSELAAAGEAIREHFGNLTILDSDTEARLFYESVRQIERIESFVAIDVGGGSVQVAWGSQKDEHTSLPIGTYRLEKQFQENSNDFLFLDGTKAKFMYNKVIESILENSVKIPKMSNCVVGSNIMNDFFRSAADFAGISIHSGVVSRDDVCQIYRACEGKAYPELASAFPENPNFMFGADKLLVVVLCFMDALSMPAVRPTNASVSKGLATLAVLGKA
jgi:hypothetical protein